MAYIKYTRKSHDQLIFVEACGFYDGNEVLLYLLKPLDNEGFSDPGLVEMLRKHSCLPLLNHKGC